jgi:hypothetical protein
LKVSGWQRILRPCSPGTRVIDPTMSASRQPGLSTKSSVRSIGCVCSRHGRQIRCGEVGRGGNLAMGLPSVRTRRLMIVVAIVALVLGAVVGVDELSRRANLFLDEAQAHRRMEEESEAKAVDWEALASNPSRESDLPSILFDSGIWSRGQALAAELELSRSPSGSRWRQLAGEAKGIATKQAQAYRSTAQYHARQKKRYDRVAFSPWLAVEPDQAPPHGATPP